MRQDLSEQAKFYFYWLYLVEHQTTVIDIAAKCFVTLHDDLDFFVAFLLCTYKHDSHVV